MHNIKLKTIKNGTDTELWLDVSEQIQELFGDIVKTAKIQLTSYDGDKYRDGYKQTAKKCLENFKKHKRFEFCGDVLEIEFNNGKTVRIFISEDGSIRGI
jgi:hypothetical protein